MIVFERSTTACGLGVALTEDDVPPLIAPPDTELELIELPLDIAPPDIAPDAPEAELELIALSDETELPLIELFIEAELPLAELSLDIALPPDIELSLLAELSLDIELSIDAELSLVALAAMPAELSAFSLLPLAELSVETVPPSDAELLPVSEMEVVVGLLVSSPPRFISAYAPKPSAASAAIARIMGKRDFFSPSSRAMMGLLGLRNGIRA